MQGTRVGEVTITRVIESERPDFDAAQFFPDITPERWAPYRQRLAGKRGLLNVQPRRRDDDCISWDQGASLNADSVAWHDLLGEKLDPDAVALDRGRRGHLTSQPIRRFLRMIGLGEIKRRADRYDNKNDSGADVVAKNRRRDTRDN